MGKNTDKQTSTTQYEQSPEQRQIMSSAMSKYMPGGTMKDAPGFDFSDPGTQWQANQLVSPFSEPSLQAFQATADNYGAERPTMDAAKGLTWGASRNAGQFQGAPTGWTTDPETGQAQYEDFDAGMSRYIGAGSQFDDAAVGRTIDDLDYTHQRANLTTADNTVKQGSFGGTREAVAKANNTKSFADAAERATSTLRLQGYDRALGQYNKGFDQGQQALSYNTGVDQANRSAELASGNQLGDQALKSQQLTGNDINALRSVGQQIEDKDQMGRDRALEFQRYVDTYGLSVAQMMMGLTPPPSSTTTSTKSVPSSSIWGTIGATAAQAGATALLSDDRAKTGVEEVDPKDALAEIRKLVPKRFEYTDDAKKLGAPEGKRTGFMAQDLEKATGEKAPHWGGGYKGVDTGEMIGRLVHAVAALDAEMSERYGKRKAA